MVRINMRRMRAPVSLSTSLDDLLPGDRAQVLEVCPPPALAGWTPWLTALGFEPGEPLRLLSRAQPGGDPLRAEAACIRVRRDAA
jgi:Fe2+ transport system protein FeoA